MKKPPDRAERPNRSSALDVTRSDLSGAVVLSVALRRYATNFLLNDLDATTADGFGRTFDEGLPFAGPTPSRRDSPVEQLHQSRVSVRRIRSAMLTFADLFQPDSFAGLNEDLSWYAGVLGAQRALEVMRENLAKVLEPLGDLELESFVLARMNEEIATADLNRQSARESQRYRQLVDEMTDLGRVLRFSARSFETAPRALRGGLRRSWKAVDDRFEVADRHPSEEHLHRLRISLKRLQYASEIMASVDAGPVAKLAKRAEATQTKLGRVHDQSVAHTWIDAIEAGAQPHPGGLTRLGEWNRQALHDALRGWRGDMRRLRHIWREVSER